MNTDPPGGGAALEATAMADLPALGSFIARACRCVGASADTQSALRLAAEEVFTNIFRHGYGKSSGPVTVTVAATPSAITVVLADLAPDFDPATLEFPETTSDWQARQIGGLGWHLVRQMVDEVHRAPGRHGGNVYTLVKHLQSGEMPQALIS